jgi:diguanylate cyclase (GGDEF)-like protein
MASFGEMLDESQRLAYTDPVTGLPNIRAAQRQLELATGRAQASQQPFSILLVDGDDLKQYNNISYAAGDEMIQRLGATLNTNLRPGDFLARWRMGDEFLVILPMIGSAQAVVVAERLCTAVRQVSQSWPLPVTISVGVAAYPDHGSSAAELLLRAEATNQQAKAAGKDNVVA